MKITLKLKRPESEKSVIFTEFSKGGVYYRFYTGKTISTGNWSNKGLVKSGEENHKLINDYLEKWVRELKRIFAEMEANQIRITKDVVQDELDRYFKKDSDSGQEGKKVGDFVGYIDAYIAKKKILNKRNAQKLNQTRKHLIIGFNLVNQSQLRAWQKLTIKEKSKTELIPDKKLYFDEINLAFIEKFREYLLKASFNFIKDEVELRLNYKINYINKQVKVLKQFLTAAIDDGYVKKFTWQTIKSECRDVDSVYTDFSEIQLLYNEPLTDETEILVRDKYVINCFLGFRYSDLNKLEPHFFSKKVISGKQYLVYSGRAKKTDQKIEFALHPIAEQILTKYDFKLPKLSEKEFNKVIKVISQKAGINSIERIREIRGTERIQRDEPKYKLMSSHAGRRSFCTNFYNEGVSIGAIMSISGHTTEKEFRKYIKKASIRLEVVAEQISAIKGINHLRVA